MYVGVPKNYGGTAFNKENPPQKSAHTEQFPSTLPHSVQASAKKMCTEGGRECKEDKNPLSCLLGAFKRSKNSGLDTEELLLLGLIILLLSKEGNEDIVIILAMLLIM